MRPIACLLAVAVLAACSGCMFMHTRANFQKIVPGMSRQEAEAIVGWPWYRAGKTARYGWLDGDFQITYDNTGRVVDKTWD